MSKQQMLIKDRLQKLDLTQALKVKGITSPTFDAPAKIDFKPSPTPKAESQEVVIAEVPKPEAQFGAQSVSTDDTVQNEPGQSQTLSNLDTVKNEAKLAKTLSKLDRVQSAQSLPWTASEEVRPTGGGFSMVPNQLLRLGGAFEDPLDFMIYLHLFTYSHGFNKRVANRSQAEIEQYTGAAKNTVKRSLQRLTERGWIKQWEDYQPNRVSRTWVILVPVSKTDTVKTEPCPAVTDPVSNLDSVTVSNLNTYKYINTNKANNSLSPSPQIAQYLEGLKPERKRERETQAYRQLKADYTDQQVEIALAHLLEQGLPSGEPCHSPMAYLAQAMEQVLGLALVAEEKSRSAHVTIASQIDAELQLREEELQAERETQEREQAFLIQYPNSEEQESVIAKFRRELPFISAGGAVARRLAILAWWQDREDRGDDSKIMEFMPFTARMHARLKE